MGHLATADGRGRPSVVPVVFVLDGGKVYTPIDGKPKGDALVTGCSSIFKSLECAHNIAVTLGEERRHWLGARDQLGIALRQKPERLRVSR